MLGDFIVDLLVKLSHAEFPVLVCVDLLEDSRNLFVVVNGVVVVVLAEAVAYGAPASVFVGVPVAAADCEARGSFAHRLAGVVAVRTVVVLVLVHVRANLPVQLGELVPGEDIIISTGDLPCCLENLILRISV